MHDGVWSRFIDPTTPAEKENERENEFYNWKKMLKYSKKYIQANTT